MMRKITIGSICWEKRNKLYMGMIHNEMFKSPEARTVQRMNPPMVMFEAVQKPNRHVAAS